MACLNESDLQGYLEESGPTPLRQMVESHMVSCARIAAPPSIAWLPRTSASTSGFPSCRRPRTIFRSTRSAALQSVLSRIANTAPATATITAEDHLARLLAPDTEIPWYKSIFGNIRDFVKPPELPPLELTSKPVAVKDIWGDGH